MKRLKANNLKKGQQNSKYGIVSVDSTNIVAEKKYRQIYSHKTVCKK